MGWGGTGKAKNDPVGKLVIQILTDMFGERVALVAGDMAGFSVKTLGQMIASTGLPGKEVRAALSVLLQHGLATSSSCRRPPVVDYTLQSSRILSLLHLPALLLLVRRQHGQQAESLLLQLVGQGAATASSLLLMAGRHLQGQAQGGEDIPTVYTLYNKFKLLVSVGLLTRSPSFCPSEQKEEDNHGDPPVLAPAPEPDFKALAATLSATGRVLGEEKDDSSVQKQPDCSVFWSLDLATVQQLLRDNIIVSAASRRLDSSAGAIVASLLGLVAASSKGWAPVSCHLGHHAIAERVAQEQGKDSQAATFLDQYLRLLADDKTRFVDRVGDAGGGQYSVDMAHIVQQLAEASLDCAVLERFGSKALRIVRYVREKKYVEEGSLQSTVMIPTKETKSLTYQLLESHFLHTQELRKNLASNAPSKSFHLFYVNLDQVVRSCVSLCHKSLYNSRRRQEVEALDHARLLEKRSNLDSVADRIRADPNHTEEELAEVEELMTPPEKESLGKVQAQLAKLAMARIQTAETLFLLETHLQYRIS